MQSEFKLTPKQAEYIRNANHRWNVACGAVRSGKSYCQISYCIPARLTERKGLRGLRVILGATRSNIERNILQPMRDVYGDGIATAINSQNYARIMGEKVYCIGADNVRQVAKIRGSEIAYCAIDEATDLNQEVFEMLKSRLSLPWSCCDITTNPASPSHWFKEFLDSADHGVDIYCQNYTIYDNPFLPVDFVRGLEAEYAGTVWYDRYIKGLWTLAEGLIYPMYGDCLEDESPEQYNDYALSIDYGTQNAFAAVLWGLYDGTWHAFRGYYYSGRDTGKQKTDEDYKKDMVKFVEDLPVAAFVDGGLYTILDPSAASFKAALREVTMQVPSRYSEGTISTKMFRVHDADNNVSAGIQDTNRCIQSGRIKVNRNTCKAIVKEFGGYVWDKDSGEDRPVKENDHGMDAIRYFVKTRRLVRPEKPKYESPYNKR